MAKRTFKPQLHELDVLQSTTDKLPINDPVAVYYRQSTDAQVGNISTDIQTIDMMDYLKRRGWREDAIIMIDTDEGISGTTKIDERLGMKTLFDLITEHKIRAVACQDEDRLFRDVTQIQVNIFIQACKDAHVLVITPSMVYDFAHEQLGAFHVRQFRFKSEMAAEYINSVIVGKLHRAKNRLMREGRWAGARIPLGYMIDIREKLPDGSDNPHWRKYVPFEPYAEVVAAYFRLFLEVGGNIAATARRIKKERLYFPNPASCPPPEGFAVYYHIKNRGDGYYFGRSGLTTLLTNPSYIGHWVLQGAIVRQNNHPAIVSDDIFMQAFNYLSEHALDGEKNHSYRPIRQNVRPSLDSERPVERPLCAGLMYGLVNGEWKPVSTGYVNTSERYAYELFERGIPNDKTIWERRADWIDAAISRHFRKKLEDTFNSEVWQQTISTFTVNLERERRLVKAQITTLEEAKKNLVASLETASNPAFIQDIEARYEATEREQRLQKSKLEAMENDHRQYERLQSLQGTFEDAIERWDLMTRDEKHQQLEIFVDRIEVLEVIHLGGMKVRICWRGGSSEEIKINKMPTHENGWKQYEIDELLGLVDEGNSQLQIAEAFPSRRWKQIALKIRQFRGRVVFSPMYLSLDETYTDFIERGGIPYRASNINHWTECEVVQLRALVERNAVRLEFMAAFPHRRWDHIRRKIKETYGCSISIAKTDGTTRDDTYLTYIARHPDTSSAANSLLRRRTRLQPIDITHFLFNSTPLVQLLGI